MIQQIDFSCVCGEDIVAQTATVDQQVVKDLFSAFMAIPSSVVVKFKNDRGFLKMAINMTHKERILHTYETYADAKLVENIIGSMKGSTIGALEHYKSEEHQLEASEADPRIDLFKQFVNSPLSCRFSPDFITENGDRYLCVGFQIGFRKEVRFCLKRTEEVEAIVNELLRVA